MTYLSKSKYCGLWQCPKIAWMKKYMPEELKLGDDVLTRMANGNVVGDLAMGLFGSYVDVTEYTNGKIDIAQMIQKTQDEMSKGTENICEASFSYNGLYCAVDILRKEENGWSIYEVKSSSNHQDENKKKDDKPVYIADISYQKYVLENCSINVIGTYLICLNKDYIFNGTLDINELFTVSNVYDEVEKEMANVVGNLAVAERILNDPNEPDIDLNKGCNSPYRCGFWCYCSRHLPEVSVFNLYRMQFGTKLAYYKKGKIDYSTLISDPSIKNEIHLRQMEHYLQNKPDYIDKEGIRLFLSQLYYPLYFLDFETMQPAVPAYTGTHPYQQIPFQYSLHYIEYEGGPILHKEFLAESGTDPRRELVEHLCNDIPENVCVTAYNKSFECGRIRELAKAFPDLESHLLNIEANIVDLLDPFRKGYYYNRAMGGSFSIKSVLPALFPNDPSLDYHNLNGVHNGSEAMAVFPKIKDMSPEEQLQARENLLKYCELDTFAMVKVWEKLVEAAK